MPRTFISYGITVINIITMGYSRSQNELMQSSVPSHITRIIKALQHFSHRRCRRGSSPLGLLNFHSSHWTIADHYALGIYRNAASHMHMSPRQKSYERYLVLLSLVPPGLQKSVPWVSFRQFYTLLWSRNTFITETFLMKADANSSLSGRKIIFFTSFIPL